MADTVVGAFYDEFSEGGLLDDVDVTIKTFRYREWDYNGTVQKASLGLQLQMIAADGTETVDVASAGDLENFRPSPDGKKAVPMKNTIKMNRNTNAMLMLISLMQADTRGELAAKLRATDDISILDGVKVHILRAPQPKRKNMPTIVADTMVPTPGAPVQQAREKMYISVTKLIAYPWENGVGAAAPSGPAATAVTVASPAVTAAAPVAAAPVAAAGDTTEIASAILFNILLANNNKVLRTALAGKIFADDTYKGLPPATKNLVLGQIVGDAFLLGPAAAMGITFNPATGEVTR